MQSNEKINQIIADFSFFNSWEEKYQYIIDMGKKLPVMDEALKTENTKVKGCMSQVWFLVIENDGKLNFIADSDAIIVKGLIGLLLKVYDGMTKDEIANTDIDYLFKQIELDNNLAGTRRNGLASIVAKIKSF